MKRNLVGKILGKIKIFVQDFVPIRTALMGAKFCTKILNFSTRFSCCRRFRNALYGEKTFWWGNVLFGHGFDKRVDALLCGGDTKFKLPNGNGNVCFPNKRVRFARAGKAVALQYHYQ